MYTTHPHDAFWFPNLLSDIIADSLDTHYDQKHGPRHHSAFRSHVEGFNPAVNIIEAADSYRIEMAAPGLKKEDITIKLNEDNELVVSTTKNEVAAQPANEVAENAADAVNEAEAVAANNEEAATADNKEEKPAEHYLRRDFQIVDFSQAFTLPEDVDLDQISAKADAGILTITLGKKKPVEPEKVTRNISID